MSATITIGTGADAVEVEDGASVPLTCKGQRARVSRITDGVVVLCYHVGKWLAVDPATGQTRFFDFGGHDVAIDLAALRRERAPKPATVGGWATHDRPSVRIYELRGSIDDGPVHYWTHRPGNTPEKQAAFDAAMEAWMAKWGEVNFAPPDGEMTRFIDAARALGYGAKR